MKHIALTMMVFGLMLTACLPQASAGTEKLKIKSGDKTHTFQVEVARDEATMAKGLMFRESLASNAGMLFEFQDNTERHFWMRNTLIPLDILFIQQDGTIHHIHPQAQPHDETVISSQGPVRGALEIPGGEAAKRGIQPGDKVLHPFFSDKLAD